MSLRFAVPQLRLNHLLQASRGDDIQEHPLASPACAICADAPSDVVPGGSARTGLRGSALRRPAPPRQAARTCAKAGRNPRTGVRTFGLSDGYRACVDALRPRRFPCDPGRNGGGGLAGPVAAPPPPDSDRRGKCRFRQSPHRVSGLAPDRRLGRSAAAPF